MQYSSRALWLFVHDDRSENEWRFWRARAIPSMKTNETQCKITVKILTWSTTLKQTNKQKNKCFILWDVNGGSL